MRTYFFLLFFLFSIESLSKEIGLQYFVNGKYIGIKIERIENLKINCSTKAKCKALAVAKGKPFKAEESTGPSYHNAGASYCWDVGAKNRILKDAKNNEYDFCVFDDGSMIDAWNLYSKHYPPKRIK